MAINATGLSIIAKGVQNVAQPTNKMTFWRTNFNMPVPFLFNGFTWNRFTGPLNYTEGIGTSSYDLSSFTAGHEIVLATGIWDWENTGGSVVSFSANLNSRWCFPSGATMFNGAVNFFLSESLNSNGGWYEYAYSTNVGTDSDEVNTSGTYSHRISATGANPLSEIAFNVAFSNVPNVAAQTLSSAKRGYMWVEGNDLCYNDGGSDSGGSWKQTIVGVDVSSSPGTSKAGYIWLDGFNIHWVGANGHDYRPSWYIRQFASTFSNGATGEVFAGAAKAGYIWVDVQFGTTHLGYIAATGYKYQTGSGDYPNY